MTDDPPSSPRGRASRVRVLIVDDSPTVLKFLQAIFESEDYEVLTAGDGNEGLAQVYLFRPDLIVTDSVMPGLDGFAFLRSLRGDPATDLIPVIMLTSGDPDDPEHAGHQPQPDAFVRKSADVEPLLAEVRDALTRRP
jgi:DNA-binding response OmpR family regulator